MPRVLLLGQRRREFYGVGRRRSFEWQLLNGVIAVALFAKELLRSLRAYAPFRHRGALPRLYRAVQR